MDIQPDLCRERCGWIEKECEYRGGIVIVCSRPGYSSILYELTIFLLDCNEKLAKLCIRKESRS